MPSVRSKGPSSGLLEFRNSFKNERGTRRDTWVIDWTCCKLRRGGAASLAAAAELAVAELGCGSWGSGAAAELAIGGWGQAAVSAAELAIGGWAAVALDFAAWVCCCDGREAAPASA